MRQGCGGSRHAAGARPRDAQVGQVAKHTYHELGGVRAGVCELGISLTPVGTGVQVGQVGERTYQKLGA